MDEEQLDRIANLPKVELHAHLAGSVPQSLLKEMASDSPALARIVGSETRTLEECVARRPRRHGPPLTPAPAPAGASSCSP